MYSILTNIFIFTDTFLYGYGYLIINNYKNRKEGIVCVLNNFSAFENGGKVFCE